MSIKNLLLVNLLLKVEHISYTTGHAYEESLAYSVHLAIDIIYYIPGIMYRINIRTSIPDDHPNNYNDNLSNDCIFNPSNLNLTKIKILSLNCCSLRSSGKRANFIALVDENNPDIICTSR